MQGRGMRANHFHLSLRHLERYTLIHMYQLDIHTGTVESRIRVLDLRLHLWLVWVMIELLDPSANNVVEAISVNVG